MSKQFSMDDYIDVAERIVAFNAKYPDGSLQTVSWQVAEVGGRPFIVYHAAAYRTADDQRPGHGIAWEPFPGPTPYTKDSELMNAETAAWGRAIVACGLPASRKIASKQEVKARQGSEQNGNGTVERPPLPDASVGKVTAAIKAAKMPHDWLRMQLVALGAENVPDGPIMRSTILALTEEQAEKLVGVCGEVVDARKQAEAKAGAAQ